MTIEVIAALAVAVWLYLAFARGGFWLASEREEGGPTCLPVWPTVTAVIPARNEADAIGECIGSLLAQDYPGDWSVILVDDDSSDGTTSSARQAAAAANQDARLAGLPREPPPARWTRKLWAGQQGIHAAPTP